jgi:Ca-activated chloride channel family protein
MSELDFAQASWLWLLSVSLLLLVAFHVWRQRRLTRLSSIGSPELLQMLVPNPRKLWFFSIPFSLALAALVVGLARPKYGEESSEEQQGGVDLCVAFDLSKSMYAQDIAPTRLARARSEVDDLLERVRASRVCIVAFAGSADVYPLTSDREAVRFYLRDLSPEDMPIGGTAIAAALRAAKRALLPEEKPADGVVLPKSVLLITDGEETAGGNPLEAASELAALGVRVFALGIGGKNPEPIPSYQEGQMVGYQRDGEARSALDETTLRQITERTQGRYASLEEGTSGILAELRQDGQQYLESRKRSTRAERFALCFTAAFFFLCLEIFLATRKEKS